MCNELPHGRAYTGIGVECSIRIPIDSGRLGFEPKIAGPHSQQNDFSPPPSGGFQIRSFSTPATIRKVSGAGWACADAAHRFVAGIVCSGSSPPGRAVR
ncbi:MAG: hypothetical protein ACM3QU_07475 [Verrucomicrobiota bacterium]